MCFYLLRRTGFALLTESGKAQRSLVVKILRYIAAFLILGPIFSTSAKLWAFIRAQTIFAEMGDNEQTVKAVASTIAINLYITVFGLFAVALGIFLQWWLARKTGEYSRSIWILSFAMAVLLCLGLTGGFIFGVILLILLFTLDTFKKMRDGKTISVNRTTNTL